MIVCLIFYSFNIILLLVMKSRTQDIPSPRPARACVFVSSRQHFNFLRNNSSSMVDAMNWDHLENNQAQSQRRSRSHSRQNEKSPLMEKSTARKSNNQTKLLNKSSLKKNTTHAKIQTKKPVFQRNPEQIEEEARKKQQNVEKIKKHFAEMVPFTRTLSNTKFQDYYNKSAFESYGRQNTKQPIGGIIYGDHLKTFNINPHSHTNNPKNYQTFKTSLNFAKRTKINEEEKFKKLQKQLGKKLGLNVKNQTLKEGKNVVYVDVNQDTFYETMKDNHEFAKRNFDEIRNAEKEYQQQKERVRLLKVQQFYQDKQNKIASGLDTIKSAELTRAEDNEDFQDRIKEQVIYKYHSKDGVVRTGADRHSMTCFVDMNFPENGPIYTSELKKRLPIYPEKVEDVDQNLHAQRVNNYQKSKSGVYPSHYLVSNAQQPELTKMLMSASNKWTNKTGISGKSTRM